MNTRSTWQVSLAVALLGCSDPAPPAPVATPTPVPVAAPVATTVVEPVAVPEVEPTTPTPAPSTLRIPRSLIASLSPVDARPPRGEVSAEECARNCALLSPTGELTLVLQELRGEASGYPQAIMVARMSGTEPAVRSYPIAYTMDQIDAYEENEGAPVPWLRVVRRALGDISTQRFAENIITHTAATDFSLEEVWSLVALGAPLEGRILYAEVGETSYRIHLARRDGSDARLLATLPIQPTACDGMYSDLACAAPLSIQAVYASPDGRFLNVVYRQAAAGDFQANDPQVLALPLDDASALPSAITPESRREDMLRSMRAPGPVSRIWQHDDSMETRGEQCDHGCGLFFENNEMWFVRPSRIAQGEPVAPTIFRPDGATAEVLISAGDGADIRAAAIERGLSDAPAVLGRRIVSRQANASWEGVIHVPLVELRAPHAGAQLSMEVDGQEYVIRMRRGDTEVELGRVPALRVNGRVSPPTIVEVFVPPVLGSPITVLGAAPTRLPSAEEGLEHTYFHATLPLR